MLGRADLQHIWSDGENETKSGRPLLLFEYVYLILNVHLPLLIARYQ